MQNFKTRKKNEKKPIKYENVFKKNIFAFLYHYHTLRLNQEYFRYTDHAISYTDETTNSS